MSLSPVASRLRQKLEAAFAPLQLDIIDDSARHAGHAGARPGGESHFSVRIVSAAFDGKSRLERQRQVYQVLSDELAGPVHALALILRTPHETTPA